MSVGHESGPPVHHHHSHQHLLTVEQAEYAPHAQVDAVIVPATRPVESLHTAKNLVSKLGCVLVVLCSRNISARQVVRAGNENISIVALDVDEVDVLPAFGTSAAIAGSRHARPNDLSRKRNLGLLLCRVAGWQRVLFLDDDIDDVHPSDVRAAAGLLNKYDVVGLRNGGFADNSVVCRAARNLGHPQDQFIGGGALAVAPSKIRTFFPDIYNEDWFFLLGAERMAVTGSMWHRGCVRAIDASRARQEELGDCLGEGLYWARDNGMSPPSVDRGHWNGFLANRRWFIDELSALNEHGLRLAEVTTALEAAYEECEAIAEEPDLCEGYMRRWHSDLAVWRDFVKGKPAGLGLVKALTELGWSGIAQLHLLPWHEGDRLTFPNGWERTAADWQARQPLDRSGQSSPLAPATTRGGVAI